MRPFKGIYFEAKKTGIFCGGVGEEGGGGSTSRSHICQTKVVIYRKSHTTIKLATPLKKHLFLIQSDLNYNAVNYMLIINTNQLQWTGCKLPKPDSDLPGFDGLIFSGARQNSAAILDSVLVINHC